MCAYPGCAERSRLISSVLLLLPFADIVRWSREPRRLRLQSFVRCARRHVSSRGRSERPRELQDGRADGAPHAVQRVAGAPVLRRLSVGPLRRAAEPTAPSAVRPEQILVPLAVRPLRPQPGARPLGYWKRGAPRAAGKHLAGPCADDHALEGLG